jgi:hypothetical protein
MNNKVVLNNLIIIVLILVLLPIVGCTTNKQVLNSSSTFSEWVIAGSRWLYTDYEREKIIIFWENGILKTFETDGIEYGDDEDFWEQNGKEIYFYYSNKFSTYEGLFVTNNLIKGIGKNAINSWEFELKRIE